MYYWHTRCSDICLLTNNHLCKTWGLHPWWFWFQGMQQYLYWSSWIVLFDIYGYICSKQMLPSPRNFHPKGHNRLASFVPSPILSLALVSPPPPQMVVCYLSERFKPIYRVISRGLYFIFIPWAAFCVTLFTRQTVQISQNDPHSGHCCRLLLFHLNLSFLCLQKTERLVSI